MSQIKIRNRKNKQKKQIKLLDDDNDIEEGEEVDLKGFTLKN